MFTVCFTFSTSVFAKSIRCKKQAEAIGILESKKKGNLSPDELSVGNPTEQDGDSIIVYIGSHAYYNYFKMKLDKKCKLITLEEVEYAQ